MAWESSKSSKYEVKKQGDTEARDDREKQGAITPLSFRVAPKTGNQKGNYVVNPTTYRRDSLFDFFIEE